MVPALPRGRARSSEGPREVARARDRETGLVARDLLSTVGVRPRTRPRRGDHGFFPPPPFICCARRRGGAGHLPALETFGAVRRWFWRKEAGGGAKDRIEHWRPGSRSRGGSHREGDLYWILNILPRRLSVTPSFSKVPLQKPRREHPGSCQIPATMATAVREEWNNRRPPARRARVQQRRRGLAPRAARSRRSRTNARAFAFPDVEHARNGTDTSLADRPAWHAGRIRRDAGRARSGTPPRWARSNVRDMR